MVTIQAERCVEFMRNSSEIDSIQADGGDSISNEDDGGDDDDDDSEGETDGNKLSCLVMKPTSCQGIDFMCDDCGDVDVDSEWRDLGVTLMAVQHQSSRIAIWTQ